MAPAWYKQAKRLFLQDRLTKAEVADRLDLPLDAISIASDRVYGERKQDAATRGRLRGISHHRRRPITLPALKCLSDQNKA